MANIFKSLFGGAVGLDINDNLVVRGSKLILNNKGTPVEITSGGGGGGGTTIGSSTWAARGSGSAARELKVITDLGPPGGVLMMWDATNSYWRLMGATDLYEYLTLTAGSAGLSGTEQIVKQITLDAGILRCARTAIVRLEAAKDGTTDAATSVKLRIGAAPGAITDAQLMTSSNLSATSRVYLAECWVTPINATTLRLKSVTNGTRGWPDTGVTTAFPVDITVPNLDTNPLVLSLTVTMAGNTNVPQGAHMLVHMIP